MVLVTYEIQFPSRDETASLPLSVGAIEVEGEGDGKRVRLRDVLAQWPFHGSFHFRAQFSPPNEPHVYLDVPDHATPLPVQSDGTVALRALSLDGLVGGAASLALPPGETWAWTQEDLYAWSMQRQATPLPTGSSRSGRVVEGGVEVDGVEEEEEEGGEEEGEGDDGNGGIWDSTDSGFQEGGPGVGGKPTLADRAEEVSRAAGEAATKAMAGAGKMFSKGLSFLKGLAAPAKGDS